MPYVVNRAGDGPGLKWDRIPQNVRYSAVMTGVAFLMFVLVALIVLYVTRVRGHPTGGGGLVLSALGHLAATYGLGVVLGVALGEWYCVADERAFRREALAYQAGAPRDSVTGETPFYSRSRWWPGDSQILVSPLPDER